MNRADSPDPAARRHGLRARTRQVVRTAALLGITLTMLPPFLLRMRTTRAEGRERDALRDGWVRAWAAAVLRVFAIEVVVDGEVPTAARGRIIVANHRSAIDIGVLLATFGGSLVSRGDLATWPVIGRAARAADTVFVDRAAANSGAGALRVVQRRLSEGRTVSLFPEGTTFDGDEVRPFRPGAFVSALAAEAEILPVGIAYPAASAAAFVDESFPEHLGRIARGAPTRMVVAVGAPLRPEAGERPAELSARTAGVVQGLVTRARRVAGD